MTSPERRSQVLSQLDSAVPDQATNSIPKAPGMTFWCHAAGQRLGGGETLPGGSPSACHRSGTSRFWERLLDAARTLALIKSRIFCSIYGVTRFSNHGFAPCRQGNLSC